MSSAIIDVVGIGNAIVDVIAHADERFIVDQGLAAGAMTLIDAARADSLYRAMGPAIESSGGSAGNTMAGVASLGGAGGYVGKVRDDLLGTVFRHDLTAIGVRFDTPAASVGPGARLDLEFSDGRVAATADADRPASAPANPSKPAAREAKPSAPKRVVKPVGQGSLF